MTVWCQMSFLYSSLHFALSVFSNVMEKVIKRLLEVHINTSKNVTVVQKNSPLTSLMNSKRTRRQLVFIFPTHSIKYCLLIQELCVLYALRGALVHSKLVTNGCTVKREYYLQLRGCLGENVRIKIPELWKENAWILYHLYHTCLTTLITTVFTGLGPL